MKAEWKTEPLGDLCEFQRGLTYSKKDEAATSDNVVLRATNIDLATDQLDFTELKFISDKVVVPDSKKVKKDSLIICTASGSKSHLGKVAYIDDDYGYAFGGFMGMITPKNGLVPRYLFHLMTSPLYQDFIGALSDGVNINNLKFDQLKQLPVTHPSPSESGGSWGFWTKRLPASPPPKPTPKRTSTTPVLCLKATSTPSSPNAATAVKTNVWATSQRNHLARCSTSRRTKANSSPTYEADFEGKTTLGPWEESQPGPGGNLSELFERAEGLTAR